MSLAWLVLVSGGAAFAGAFEDGVIASSGGDYVSALRLYQQAADKGDASAEFVLGVMYANGQGVTKDQAQAVIWYTKAAQQGEAGAQFSLGVAYRDGLGVPADPHKASYWFDLAKAPVVSLTEASNGPNDPFSLRKLTLSFGGGPGLPQNEFRLLMNNVFGDGRWRETGGYRPPEREDQLRAQGALTVPVGQLSRHSLGTPDAPGAYDIVVNGMSPYEAAQMLQRSGLRFRRLFPESSHGTQGPHLHVEPAPVNLPISLTAK